MCVINTLFLPNDNTKAFHVDELLVLVYLTECLLLWYHRWVSSSVTLFNIISKASFG